MGVGAILTLIIFLNALTHKPHNIFLNALLLCTSCKLNATINTLFDSQKCSELYRLFIQCVAHFWLGKCFFFYQGNSNSLATIDLNAGYIGLDHFELLPVMFFLTINTYNGPILAFLLLIYNELDAIETKPEPTKRGEKQQCEKQANIPEIVILMSILVTLPFIVYCFVTVTFRHHIFVWTVFSPKLIYETYHLVLMSLMYSSTGIILGNIK